MVTREGREKQFARYREFPLVKTTPNQKTRARKTTSEARKSWSAKQWKTENNTLQVSGEDDQNGAKAKWYGECPETEEDYPEDTGSGKGGKLTNLRPIVTPKQTPKVSTDKTTGKRPNKRDLNATLELETKLSENDLNAILNAI